MDVRKENFEKLFSIIKNYPMSHILHIDEGNKEFIESLFSFVMENDLVYHLNVIDKKIFDSFKDKFDIDKRFKIKLFSFSQERYTQHSVLYDTAFLTVDISTIEDKEDFFKKVYRVMKNSGDIIFFIKEEDKEKIVSILERLNYVAINYIEGFDSFVVLTGKKMHGWKRV